MATAQLAAKFGEHHSNISRDILDFVIYPCTETLCRHQFLNKDLKISGMREDISETKMPLFVTLKGLSSKHK